MPDQIAVRDARVDENKYIMEMTRLMVCEMERYGGAQSDDRRVSVEHACCSDCRRIESS
jgi:hypothetical protein